MCTYAQHSCAGCPEWAVLLTHLYSDHPAKLSTLRLCYAWVAGMSGIGPREGEWLAVARRSMQPKPMPKGATSKGGKGDVPTPKPKARPVEIRGPRGPTSHNCQRSTFDSESKVVLHLYRLYYRLYYVFTSLYLAPKV